VYVSRRAQPPVTATLLVRTTGSPASIAPTLRERLRDLDPNLPLARAMTLDDALQQVRWLGQVSSLLLYGVGASALVLALVGTACTAAFDRLFTTTTQRLTDADIMGPTLMAMTVVALAASVVPALAAARVDPVTVLHED
jgi:hypothetical protein